MPLLDIQPRTLEFVVGLKKPTSCVVELTNTTRNFVAFKVKTTSPSNYGVRPNVGVVAPKSSCEFTVILQAFIDPPPHMVREDKFLIQSTAVPAETTDEDITTSMFSKVEGKHIEEKKLKVTLVLPSDSPELELSPVSGTFKVFESSILKDRSYCQSETLPPQYENEIVKEPRTVGHDELKAYDAMELKPQKMGIMDFNEDLNPANDLEATRGGYDTLEMAKETEFDPVRSHKDADDGRAMDLRGDHGFTNGITSAGSVTYPDEPKKIPRDRDVVQLQKTDAQRDEYKLVKDIEEMTLKVSALESKLKQADSTISKAEGKFCLKGRLKSSAQTKMIMLEVHIGFPLLFVCLVAFISVVIGYCLPT